MRSILKYAPIFIFLLTFTPAKAAFITLFIKNATCGNNNGSASVSATGFTLPLTYSWSNGDTLIEASNLSPGNYTVLVTDIVGVSDSATFEIFNDTSLSNAEMSFYQPGSLSIGNFPCKTSCNGTAYLDIHSLNGTAPYTITSSLPGHTNGTFTPGNIPTLENVCPQDMYTVLVTDANGCTAMAIPTPVLTPNYFEFSQIVAPACNGSANGTISFDFYHSQLYPYFITCTDSVGNILTGSLYAQHTTITGFHPGNYSCLVSNPLSTQGCDSTFNLFMPDAGPDCGMIYGNVFADTLQNCLFDVNELPIAFQVVEINPGPYYATTDSAGNYRSQLPVGMYDVTALGTINLFGTCPMISVQLSAPGDSAEAQMGLTSLGPDLDITITGSAAIPGNVMTQYILVKNTSYYTTSGSTPLDISYDTLLVFDSLSIPIDMFVPGFINVTIPVMNRLEEMLIKAYYTVPADTINLGRKIMTDIASASSDGSNFDTLTQEIAIAGAVNRMDVIPSDDPLNTYLPGTDMEIRYTVYFGNTTPNPLSTVVLNDTLDNLLDFATLRIVGYSHNCTWSLSRANILRVEFPNINLPVSGMESLGQFTFGIQPKRNIPLPSTINNSMVIYFDTLPAFQTNSVISTVDLTVGLENISPGNHLLLYPNPVQDVVSIRLSNAKAGTATISIFNLEGRKIRNEILPEITSDISLSVADLANGSYFLQVEINNERFVSKFMILH